MATAGRSPVPVAPACSDEKLFDVMRSAMRPDAEIAQHPHHVDVVAFGSG